MGMLGRMIDVLPPHQKDRIIEAQLWVSDAFCYHNGSRCLVGHAENWYYEGDILIAKELHTVTSGMSGQFDSLAYRFGLPRIVRACKLRAGKPQPVLLPATQHTKLHHTLTTVGG